MALPIATIGLSLAAAGLKMYGGHSAVVEFVQHPLDLLAGHSQARNFEDIAQRFKKWAEGNVLPENQDLAIAVSRSAILADMLCLVEALPQEIGGIGLFNRLRERFGSSLNAPPYGVLTQAHESTVRLAIQACERRLKDLDSGAFVASDVDPLNLMVEPPTSPHAATLARGALEAVEREHSMPDRVRTLFLERWFGYMCLVFHEEIKTNDRARRIFALMQTATGFITLDETIRELDQLIRDEAESTRRQIHQQHGETGRLLREISGILQPHSLIDRANELLEIPRRPWDPTRLPPGALLRADSAAAVPFHSREAERADIENWCRDDAMLGIRLYTAAGGMGKTRLFLEVCESMTRSGWRGGFLRAKTANASEKVWGALIRQRLPLLLVVDYAESRRPELINLLREVVQSTSGPVRIVLLARAAGDWWEAMKRAEDGVGDVLSGPATRWHSVQPLAADHESREASFWTAAQAFADALGQPLPSAVPGDLDAPHFDRVLLLHMSALAAIDGVQVKGDQGILHYVLNRERGFWSRHVEAKGLPAILENAVAQAMAVLTLGGGATDLRHARLIMSALPLLKDQPELVRHAIAIMLHEAYPGEKWIEPMLPDLLGEHLVQIELGKDDGTLLDLVLGSPDNQSEVSPSET